MKVGIYIEPALDAQATGIGRHVSQIVRELPRVDPTSQFYLYFQQNLLSKRHLAEIMPRDSNVVPRGVRFPSGWVHRYPRIWWDRVLPAAIRRDRLDVFHGPNHFLPASCGVISILTVHDLAFLKMSLYPDGLAKVMRTWLEKSLKGADRVIAISDNTRNDLVDIGVGSERIRIVHNGAHIVDHESIRTERLPELRKRYELPDKYILFVSTVAKRKNVPFLVDAFARLKSAYGIPHKLVLAGQKGTAYEETCAAVERHGLREQVIFTGYIEDWELPLLYKNADVFVLPSLYEGFTIVTLEAMGYGAPVVVADNSSNRENVGDAGLLVGIDNVDEFASGLYRVLSDGELRSTLVQRGLDRSRIFTWRRAAERTLEVYREAFEARRNFAA